MQMQPNRDLRAVFRPAGRQRHDALAQPELLETRPTCPRRPRPRHAENENERSQAPAQEDGT